ncbi:MAG: hypothetical protein ACTSVY_16380 [Candidatus Helarchaeota archaeon]
MFNDISKDPRILIVEYVLNKLKNLTIQKRYKLPASKEKTLEAIGRLNSSIKKIKYSYKKPTDLAEDRMVKEFDLMVKQFWDAILKNKNDIEKDKFISADLRFIFNVLSGFKMRLMLGNEITFEKSIDIIAVRVISISTLNKKENLKICRVGDGNRILNIVTNLSDIKKDMVVPAAILPPREFENEISEAMFCSSSNLTEMHEKVGERVTLLKSQLKEVNSQIMSLLKNV